MALETTGDEAGLKARSHLKSATRISGNTRANVKSIWLFTVSLPLCCLTMMS